MRKVTLFIAMSLDGYIADTSGGVDWLGGQDDGAETEDTYSVFIRDIDTVVMGWKTYHQVATQLSPNEWPYEGLVSYVVTHRELPSTENIRFVQSSPSQLVSGLRMGEGKNIWVCGGADIIRQLMDDGLIDRLHISIIPTLLGGGIPLFGALDGERELRLLESRSYNGITEVVYEKR